MQQNYPHGFMPVWATENISDVTTYLATNSTDFHDPYAEILTGTEESGTPVGNWLSLKQYNYHKIIFIDCSLPCTETLIKTVLINEFDKPKAKKSRIDIAFSTTVTTSINHFPTFHFSTFMAQLGGTAGLWLGLGILQLLDLISSIVTPYFNVCHHKQLNISKRKTANRNKDQM